MATEAARRSVVLLKNDGTLPLRADALKTLAVIGPNAAVAQLGGYSTVPRRTVSALDVINVKLGNRVRVVTAEGVRLTDKGDGNADEVVLADPQENRRWIQEAVQVAQGADAIVLAIGGSAATSREAWADNHLGDTTSIELGWFGARPISPRSPGRRRAVGEQNELARALFGLRKPVVVVLINGRPQAVAEFAARANALLEGGYLGQEGGTALTDILFGDANPGGKLPVTLPRSVGQVPLVYNEKPSAHRAFARDPDGPILRPVPSAPPRMPHRPRLTQS